MAVLPVALAASFRIRAAVPSARGPATKVRTAPALSLDRAPSHNGARNDKCAARVNAARVAWRKTMSDKIYEVPAEWKQRALHRRGQVPGDVRALARGPERLLGRAGQAHRTGTRPSTKDQEHVLRSAQRLDQMVRGRRAQRRLQLHRPPSAEARRPDRDHLGRRRPEGRQAHHLSGAARRGLPVGQRPAQPQRREGRPRHHLHADDPGGGLRDARLRAHRRDPLGGVRRLLARLARRPHRGLPVERRHHRRRRPARRPQGAAQGQHRRGASPRSAASSTCIVVRAPAARSTWMPGRDVWYHEAADGRDQPTARASR